MRYHLTLIFGGRRASAEFKKDPLETATDMAVLFESIDEDQVQYSYTGKLGET